MNKTPTFRFDIVENGVCIGQAFALNKPSVKCDSDAEVKLSLSGEFVLNIQKPNWLKARIKPYLIIGGKESSLGEYLISQADDCMDKKGLKFWQIKGMDLGRIPQRSRTEKESSFKQVNVILILSSPSCLNWESAGSLPFKVMRR